MVDDNSSRLDDDDAWRELGMSRLDQEWDNPADAVYDQWKQLYATSTNEPKQP
jgi:hypothetical protein